MTETINPDDFDLEDPEIQADPYPYYPVLREHRPVYRTTVSGQPCWVLSRREEIVEVLMDPQTFSNRHTPLPNMLFSDPPEHERLRAMVASMFTRRILQEMSGEIAEHVELLTGNLVTNGRGDIIHDFASPLSIGTIGRLLGITRLQVAKLRDLSQLFIEYVRALQLGRTPSPESQRGTDELKKFMTDLVESRAYQDGRVISVLLQRKENGELTADEFVHFAILLLVAGHSTTTNLIGNCVYLLTRRPRDLGRMAANQDFIGPFVEEVLRTRPSFHRILRITTKDVELCGEFIPAGSIVRLLLASSNRDPAFFADPETFDPDRPRPVKHTAFGQGIHSCLGSWLARLEASTSLSQLSRRVTSIALDPDDPPVSHSGGSFNEFGFERLPVSLTPLSARFVT